MAEKAPDPKPRGRPVVLQPDDRAVAGSIRLTSARWAKLRRLGMAWLSRMIDKAKEPKE